jgi:prepilin-type N-terminal cleavage/methylation domain-containing protein
MQGPQKRDFGFSILDFGLGANRARQSGARRPESKIQNPKSKIRTRRGFTLTELLIVIAIIGVLASLITAAAINALHRAREARMLLEIKGLTAALESFNTDLNAYPPNGMNDGTPVMIDQVSSDFERLVKGAFPNIHPTELSVFRALAGDMRAPTAVTSDPLEGGMSAGEALFFWLGGFSSDAKFPLTGPGGPAYLRADGFDVFEDRTMRYEFNLGRLGPRTEEDELDYESVRHIFYTPSMNGDTRERRIDLWRFVPDGSTQPYVYFDTSRNRPAKYDMPAYNSSAFPDEPVIYPLLQRRTGVPSTAPRVARNLMFANNKKFQILHAGLDDAWGDFTPMGPESASFMTDPDAAREDDGLLVLFPTGPFLDEVADTLTNFTDGGLEDSQEE